MTPLSYPWELVEDSLREVLMEYVHMTAHDLALRYVGTREVGGALDNPAIMAMLRHVDGGDFTGWPQHDEVPWCSAFVNWICWHLRLPRSKHLQARSWLEVGRPIKLEEAKPMNDVVVLKRGGDDSGPEVVDNSGPVPVYPPGHVGFFSGLEGTQVHLLGGNQSNSVKVSPYPVTRILGVRRLL